MSLSIGIAVVLLAVSVGFLSAGVVAEPIDDTAGMSGDAAETTTVAPTYELEIDNDGSAAAIGFPGPVNGTVDDLFVKGTDGVSAVYRYSPADATWNNVLEGDGVDDFDDVSVDPMDSLVVLTTGQGDSETISLKVSLKAQTDETGTSDQRDVDAGWNFVSAPQYTDADAAFGADSAATASLVLERYDGPRTVAVEQTPEFGEYYLDSGQPPVTDPFSGYFVFAQDDGALSTAVSDVADRDDADAQLGLPVIEDVSIGGEISSSAEDGNLADEDVTVRLDGEEVDVADGAYETTVDPGEYTLTVEADGHRTETRELDARFGTQYDEDIALDGRVDNGTRTYVSAAAATADAAEGDTIVLRPGTYDEDVTIETDGVTLLTADAAASRAGPDAAAVETEADDGSTVTINGVLEIDDADNVTVADVSVRSDHYGVSVVDSEDISLSAIDATVGSSGLHFDNASSVETTDFRVEEGLYGVTVQAEGGDLEDVSFGRGVEFDVAVPVAVVGEDGTDTTAVPEISLEDDLNYRVPMSDTYFDDGTGFTFDEAAAIDAAIALDGEDSVDAAAVQRVSDDAFVVSPELSLQAANDLAEEGATIEVRDGTYDKDVEITTDGVTVTGDGATFEGIVSVSDARNVTIDGLRVIDAFNGLILFDSTDTTITDVEVSGAANGFGIAGSDGTEISGVTASDNERGLIVADSDVYVTVSDSTFEGNRDGILNAGDGTLTVRTGTIVGNDAGAINEGDGAIDAAENWWGTPSGPSGDAVGIGDTITDGVEYEPWLDAPPGEDPVRVEDAGLAVENFETDTTEAVRGDSITTSADVTHEVESVAPENADVANEVEDVTSQNADGSEYRIEYVLVDGDYEETIATKRVTLTVGQTERVTFEESIPERTTAHERRTVEHVVRVADEGASTGRDLELANSIETAVETADATGASTVEVEPGTYAEALTVDVDGLTLQSSDGAEETTLAAETATVAGEDITVDGFTFDGGAGDAAVVLAGDGATLRSSVIDSGDATDAVRVAAADVEVTDSELSGATDAGVRFTDGTPDGTVSESDIVDNGVGVVNDGTVTVDARWNWWGSAGGPGTSGANDASGDVGVEPWLDGPIPDGEAVTGDIAGTVTASGETSGTDASAAGTIMTTATPGETDPVSDAAVTVYPFDPDASDEESMDPITVASDGTYGIPDLPIGTHGLEVKADGFASEVRAVTVKQDARTDATDFALEYAESGTVTGEVDLDYVDPAEGLTVTVALEGTEYATDVDFDGEAGTKSFTIDGVDVDVDDGYALTASTDSVHYGEEVTVDAFAVDVGETVDVGQLTFERDTETVTGTATASGDTADGGKMMTTAATPGTGEPVTDATVTVHHFDTEAADNGDRTVDVTDGTFTVPDVPVGTHGFVLEGDSIASTLETETVETGGENVVDFEPAYASGGTVTGTVTLPHAADGDFAVDMAVLNGGTEVATGTATVPDGEQSSEYSIEDVDVNVDDGYTVEATTEAFVGTESVQDVTVDVDETAGKVDIAFDKSDAVAQNVALERDVSGTATVGETVTYTATVTNDAGTPIEGTTVDTSDDGEEITYADGQSATTDADGRATFEVSTEMPHTGDFATEDPIEFTFTESATGHSAGDTVEFEVGAAANVDAEVTSTSTATYPVATVDIEVVDEFGNDVYTEVEIDVSGFEELKDPTSGDTYTTTPGPVKFRSHALEDITEVRITEPTTGVYDDVHFELDPDR
ncbi:right-handed parallel beta-helix repeat-containing protein [Halostagnicola larsenii]|nr:right-handed parallel beta-helix repeat-containing protein [Halostagnicola larsenii]